MRLHNDAFYHAMLYFKVCGVWSTYLQQQPRRCCSPCWRGWMLSHLRMQEGKQHIQGWAVLSSSRWMQHMVWMHKASWVYRYHTLDWIGLDRIENLIHPGEAFSYEATFQGTQNYSTVQTNIAYTHTHSKSVSSVDGRGVPLFPTAPGGEPLPSHFCWSSIVTCASRPPAPPIVDVN